MRFIYVPAFIAILLVALFTAQGVQAEVQPKTPLEVKTKELLDKLDENEVRQFSAIRSTHGTIRAVENVQESVKFAVNACAQANPDLKDQITSRHDNWRAALRPTLKKAKSKLEKMILLQSYSKPSDVRNYLAMFDKAILDQNKAIKAVPITDKAECQRLIKKMDQTEDELNKLLVESLKLDEPVIQNQDL